MKTWSVGKSGVIYVLNSNGRCKVVDVPDELSKSVKDEMLDVVVLAVANTLASFTVTLSSMELIDGRDEAFYRFLCWWLTRRRLWKQCPGASTRCWTWSS